MLYLILLLLFVILAVVLGNLFKNKILKKYPQEGRQGQQFLSMSIFIVGVIIIYSVIFGGLALNSAIKKQTEVMIVLLRTHESTKDLDIVKDGINMAAISSDIENLNKTVNELNTTLWPYAKEQGIPKWLFDAAIEQIKLQIQARLIIVNAAGSVGNKLTDDDEIITIESLFRNIRTGVMNVVNIIIIIIVVIILIAVGIYIILTLHTVSKADEIKNSVVFGEAGASNKWKLPNAPEDSQEKNRTAVCDE
ncbi:MAG: hypothetical protein FWD14_01505 [Treponema sp.]|nr:hypothetical protein [Treponema sp.]